MANIHLPPPPGKFVTARGLRMHYEETGDLSGPPLLLIHGLMSSSAIWSASRERLAARFHLLMPDLIGHGYSEQRNDFSMSLVDQVEVLASFLEAVGLARTAVLGHSMGGGVAALLAARYPERVERLALANTLCYPFRMPLKGRLALIPVLGQLIITRIYRKGLYESYIRNDVFLHPERINQHVIDTHYAHLNTLIARRGIHRAMLAIQDTSELSRAVTTLRQPTLILWGAQDRLIPRVMGHRLHQDIAGSTLEVIEDCGHEIMTEQADAFARAVERFLDAPSRAPAA